MITAKIIADSVSEHGIRLTTMELNYPRFIHSEFMTHRMFSRNASSSRAIPIEKMMAQVRDNPAMPIHWGKNQSGMQANEEITQPEVALQLWKFASIDSIYWANHLRCQSVHKQIANRLLEPFQWIKVIVTATEWDNFFKLRLHKDAQPEIMVLAERMKEAMNSSTPKELAVGEWHLPYVDFPGPRGKELSLEKAIKCSVARCARVSYLNHDNSSPNIEKDIDLYSKLLEAGHMSPFEHVATPMKRYAWFDENWVTGTTHMTRDGVFWSGNFRSWIMYRKLLDG